MTYEELLNEIAARLGVDPPGRASLLTRSVLAALSAQLDGPARELLAAALPSALGEIVADTLRVEERSAQRLVEDVASGIVNTTPERARYGVQAVLSAVAAAYPDVARAIRAELPADYDELFTAPGDGPPPELAASAAEDIPTELSDTDIDRALRKLPGWRGDRHALCRTVDLPPGLDRPILERVHAAERDLQHKAVIDHSGQETTFRVWTHSIGVVTELDVRLAARITQAIENF
jgi:uncharacterized protein (DUF2267 family)/pterin-4a-carbinolamine dehydratase